MALPFKYSVAQTMPGFGSPSCYGSGAQLAAAAATTTINIPGAATAGPTGFSVTAGTPGTLTAIFALVANYANGSVSAPVYFTLNTANVATSTYIFTWTAATDGVAGTTTYSSFLVGFVGAVNGFPMMVKQLIAASPYTLGTEVLPSTGSLAFTGGQTAAFNAAGDPAPSSGKVRVRTSAVGGTGTTTVAITVTDGVTTLQVGQIPTTAAGVAIDQVFDFVTDLAITAVAVAVTMAVAAQTAVAEIEVALV